MKTLEWTTMDKSSWGEGPWMYEPDKIQWQDEETELPCLIHRSLATGALCGYVGITEDHPLYKCDDWPDIDVHGGCSYIDLCQSDHAPDGSTGICHLVEPGELDQVFWIGFDCGHSGDIMPAMTQFSGMGGILSQLMCHSSIYRDLDFVRAECKSLAKQLFVMKETPHA